MSNQYPQPIQNWQPQQPPQPHQPQQPYPFQTAPVFQPLPPKKSKRGLAVAVIVGILVLVGLAGMVNSPGFKKGFSDGYASANAPSVAVPATTAPTTAAPTTAAPTVTVTAPAPATTAAKGTSNNVVLMKLAWKNMPVSDRDSIRTAWALYKDDPSMGPLYVATFKSTMAKAGYVFTDAEVIEFLNWSLTN